MGQLGSNRRMASVSERAALLYLLSITYGDREGRLPGDARDLIDETCALLAMRWGWTDDVVVGLRDELVKAGLWSIWEVHGARVVGIERWRDHQHPSKLAEERPSELPGPPSPDPSLSSKSNPIQSKACSVENGSERNRTDAQVQVVARTEEEITTEEARIRRCWIEGRPLSWQVAARGLSMKEQREIRNAAEQNLCGAWLDEAVLTGKMRTKSTELEQLGYTVGVDATIRNLGRLSTAVGERVSPQLPLGLDTIKLRREELDEIRAEATPESRERVAAIIAEAKSKTSALARKPPGRTISAPADPEAPPEADRKPRPLAGAVDGFLEKLGERVERVGGMA